MEKILETSTAPPTTTFQHFRFHHYSSNQSLIQNSLSTNEKTRNTILRGASLASHTNEIWKCASASHIVPPLRVTTNHLMLRFRIRLKNKTHPIKPPNYILLLTSYLFILYYIILYYIILYYIILSWCLKVSHHQQIKEKGCSLSNLGGSKWATF